MVRTIARASSRVCPLAGLCVSRMLKKASNFVLASKKSSTYLRGSTSGIVPGSDFVG